jgi:transcriptional regulator with XRE-family HTH domain
LTGDDEKGLDKKWRTVDNPSRACFCLPLIKTFRRSSPSFHRKSLRGDPVADKDGIATSMEMDREVIRCQVCGLVQYRTRTGNCRRCLRLLPPKVTFVIPTPSPQDLPGDDRQLFENWPNRETVENIGQRIRQLRESRSMTQSQLQARSRVSRSYLSRIESGQMTPSLGTLEKIAEALGVGLNRFFVPETNGETVLEDPFIQGLRPYLRQLDWTQWQGILKRLQAISDHVSTNDNMRPLAPQAQVQMPHSLPRRHPQPGHSATALNR